MDNQEQQKDSEQKQIRRGIPLSQYCPKSKRLDEKFKRWEQSARENTQLYGQSEPIY